MKTTLLLAPNPKPNANPYSDPHSILTLTRARIMRCDADRKKSIHNEDNNFEKLILMRQKISRARIM